MRTNGRCTPKDPTKSPEPRGVCVKTTREKEKSINGIWTEKNVLQINFAKRNKYFKMKRKTNSPKLTSFEFSDDAVVVKE